MKLTIARWALLSMLAGVAPVSMTTAMEAPAPATAARENAGTPAVEGEIRKVDGPAGKLTIRHGPIENLDMAAMTMIFRVRDPAMLTQVQAGDKVRFTVDRIEGLLTVTSLVVEK